jgi:carbon storage regulator CsrA
MLVLSGRTGQIVHRTGGIEVQVLEVSRGTVRLGFRAPAEVQIKRDELLPLPESEIPQAGEEDESE